MRSSHPTTVFPRRSAALAAATLALTASALSGCALLEGPVPETPEREVAPTPDQPPEFVSGGSAEENLPYFREVLRQYAEGEGPVKGEPVSKAVIASGFSKETMQVSFDTSKTGLAADSIYVSVLIGSDCLIGQVTEPERDVAAEIEPAIGPAGDICLIGETREITW